MHEGHTLRIAACEVLAVARIGEGVEHRDMSIGLVVEHPMHEIGADEPGSSGDDDVVEWTCHDRLLLRAAVILSYSVKDILSLR